MNSKILNFLTYFLLLIGVRAAPNAIDFTSAAAAPSCQDNDVLIELQNEIKRLKKDNFKIKLEQEVSALKSSFLHDITNLINSKMDQDLKKFENKLLNEIMVSLEMNTSSYSLSEQVANANCEEALKNGGHSGVYEIQLPVSKLPPFDVYCLQDQDTGPWTIVQRRQDGSVDFYLNWIDYVNGFGNISGEYFIGLEKLHALTAEGPPQELRVVMRDFEGRTRFSHYDSFAIGGVDTKYALTTLGKYRGDGGDLLANHKGQKFTTKDADNDEKSSNCAVEFHGAWWYKDCFDSNLNGQYFHSGEKSTKGIRNLKWYSDSTTLKYVHMAVRFSKK